MPKVNTEGTARDYDRPPDRCPICHYAIEPRILLGTLTGEFGHRKTELEVGYKCTRTACARMFIGRYSAQVNSATQVTGLFLLRTTAPLVHVAPDIAKEVESVSPTFVEVYTQATAAEAFQLDQIAGVGYRKALEFLVKDYCISQSPNDAAAIKAKMLGQCIADHVGDTNVRVCAQRAAWLGNDETHYVRKWEDKDIKDLKILLELTMNWIRNEVLTRQYLGAMPDHTP